MPERHETAYAKEARWRKDVRLFFIAIWKYWRWWVCQILGSAIGILLRTGGVVIPGVILWLVAASGVLVAAFLAWRDQKRLTEVAESNLQKAVTTHTKETERLQSELKSLKEQASPLEIGASVTFPVVGKDNMVWKDKLVISIRNKNPTRCVKGIWVRILGISPPLDGRQINGHYTTDDCGLLGIKLPFTDIPGNALNGCVTGHIPVFEAERTAILTIVKLCVAWTSDRVNAFIPNPLKKYILTMEATADGLERKESRFELSFSLDPTHPIVAVTEIVDAPSLSPLRVTNQTPNCN